MALTVGTRLGHYDVTALLGEGGMGQVWQATDTQLNRQVALKILPDAFADDPDRLARFQREAQVLASLNHPGIAQIHGIEEADGTRALVLELVEGPTLAERIAKGPIPLEEALPIAKQIAEALEAAHEAGVIHRDLKPANIKVREDGTVKVLDFGLAKALAGDVADQDLSQSPTMTATMGGTREGVILGTAAYMSPEQARGKPLDKRTDIWAFGAVLFEMLTGQAAFAGETLPDTIARILEREPEWTVLPDAVPVERLLRRCLEKNPRDRLRDIGDARGELRDASVQPQTDEPGHASPRRKPRSVGPLGAAAAVASALVASLAVWAFLQPADPTGRLGPFAIDTPADALLRTSGVHPQVAISLDGGRLVWGARNLGVLASQPYDTLVSRRIDTLDAQPMETGRRATAPFISPDGENVGFIDEEAELLVRVPASGGQALTITELDETGPVRGASWGRDDTILFGTHGGLWRVSASGGAPEPVTTASTGRVNHVWPHILPGGQSALFTILTGSAELTLGSTSPVGAERAEIAVVDLQTGDHRVLIARGSNPHYATSEHIVYGLDGALWAVGFDVDALQVIGTPTLVLDGVNTKFSGAANFALSRDGTVVYVPSYVRDHRDESRAFVWVDHDGNGTPTPVEARPYQEFSLSPDGTRVAARVEREVWVYDLKTGARTQVTVDDQNPAYPIWTANGVRVIFGQTIISPQAGLMPLSWKAADGFGPVEALFKNDGVGRLPQAVTPDGAILVFEQRRPTDLGMLLLDGDRTPSTLWESPYVERTADLSPDGRWIAYESDKSGRFEVWVRPFPDVLENERQISTAGGQWPLWNPAPEGAGQELFYVGPDGMVAVTLKTKPTLRLGGERVLFDTTGYGTPASDGYNRRIDIAPDGQRFLMFRALSPADFKVAGPQIVVIQNWLAALKRLVPID